MADNKATTKMDFPVGCRCILGLLRMKQPCVGDGSVPARALSTVTTITEVTICRGAGVANTCSNVKGLRRPACAYQTKLSRYSNRIARRRIRRFESYMPSHAVGSLWAVSA